MDPLPLNPFHHLPPLYSQSQIMLPTLRVRFPNPLLSLVGEETDAMTKKFGYWILGAVIKCYTAMAHLELDVEVNHAYSYYHYSFTGPFTKL